MTRSLKNSLETFALSLVLVVMPACGGTSGKVAPTDAADARSPEAGLADTRPEDTGHADTQVADVGSPDTGKIDAGEHDAVVPDVAHDAVAHDAVAPDAVALDTRAADAEALDSGTDVGSACAQGQVVLGGAAPFAVLAGSTVTNTGLTVVTGDLGLSPGTAVTGFGPGTVIGTQHVGDPTAAQAEADLTTAYNDAAGRTLCPISVAGNLGGQTLTPGLYKSTSSLEISSGDLTLDAQGNPNAVFIFQMASTLTTSSGRQVVLAGGAKSTNVFWQVGTSATLGSTSSFQGTVMANQAIALSTGASLNGRALARVAAVTMDTNAIVRPTP